MLGLWSLCQMPERNRREKGQKDSECQGSAHHEYEGRVTPIHLGRETEREAGEEEQESENKTLHLLVLSFPLLLHQPQPPGLCPDILTQNAGYPCEVLSGPTIIDILRGVLQ